MFLEGVVVCYNYGDFLEHTLPDNLQHLDRVIVVTSRDDNKTRRICDKFGVDFLETDVFHGADRLNVFGYDHWLKHKSKTVPQHQYRYLVTPNEEFQLGSRLIHTEYGYCPIGYFQLWNSAMRRRYPVNQGSAEHTDVLFSVQWPRAQRILLPELFVFHLESEKSKMGTNWDGRKTKFFGADGSSDSEGERVALIVDEKGKT